MILVFSYIGAGWGNRTPTYSLENCHSTIKLIPQLAYYIRCFKKIEYDTIFKEHGGEKIQLVESLNDNDLFVDCLVEMIK